MLGIGKIKYVKVNVLPYQLTVRFCIFRSARTFASSQTFYYGLNNLFLTIRPKTREFPLSSLNSHQQMIWRRHEVKKGNLSRRSPGHRADLGSQNKMQVRAVLADFSYQVIHCFISASIKLQSFNLSHFEQTVSYLCYISANVTDRSWTLNWKGCHTLRLLCVSANLRMNSSSPWL